MRGRVLAIAGSDSGGGAGIQADIKTITALGGFATTAVTALTAQDTTGVSGIFPIPAAFVRQQIGCVLDDIGADAIKTGMLGDAALVATVCEAIMRHAPGVPVVVDPVMVAKGGARLLAEDAVAAIQDLLFPLATLLTPNVPEAEALTGQTIRNETDMREAAVALRGVGSLSVLLKGGHLEGDVVVDLLATADGVEAFRSPRLQTRHTHGTGCTLASGIAAGLSQAMTLRDAVIRARSFVHAAIASAPGFGAGHGPLNHVVWLERSGR